MSRLVFMKGNTYGGSCTKCGKYVEPHQGCLSPLKQLECSACGNARAQAMEAERLRLYGPRGGRYTRTRSGGKWYR